MKNNMIRKSNEVIEACYSMSVPELRLIYSCISKIEFEQIITKQDPFYISAIEYSKTFGVDQKNVHREIKKAVDKLWNAEIIIQRENKKPLRCRWVSAEAEYEDGGAEIHFASQIIPYLINLQESGNYTTYQLKNIGELKSSYSIRLYELLIQYKKIGVRKIQIDDIREMLCIGNKYKTMKDFKKYVLDSSIKEINAETDISVSYKNVKSGRSITALNFTIKSKNQAKKALARAHVEQNARPGETYEQVENRLKNTRKTARKPANLADLMNDTLVNLSDTP